MSTNESEFPTICDLRDRLTDLVNLGLGALPVQVIIVPASTIIATARATNPEEMKGKAPLMIEFDGREGRMPTVMVSADFLASSTKPPLSLVTQ